MNIVKIISNNAVLVSDDNNLQVISSKGIGFNAKKGHSIDLTDKSYQKFIFDKDGSVQKYLDLLTEIPEEIVEIATQIISFARENLDVVFADSVFWTLVDHINYSIDRKSMGIDLINTLHTEIKIFYPDEFAIGEKALELINTQLNVELSDHEKSFIAMHFVNAEIGEDSYQTKLFTEIIGDIAQLIGAKYNYQFDKDSLSYHRFVTHIKFFAQRVFADNQEFIEENDTLFDVVSVAFPNEFAGAEEIAEYMLVKHKKKVEKQELAYLTVHLKRVLDH